MFPRVNFTFWLIEPTLKHLVEIMFEFLVAGSGSHADLFRCIRLEFVAGCARRVGGLGRTRGTEGLCVGFSVAGGGRGRFVASEFAEVEFLDWIGLMESGGCGDGADEEGITQRAHTGGLHHKSG
jgi:hypothetical protein